MNNPDHEFIRELTTNQGPVLAYIRSLVGGSPDAQDILQKTNIILWDKKEDFISGTNFKSWAFAVARYEVFGHRKRLRRNGWLVFADDVAEQFARDLEVDNTDWEHSLSALDGCLGKLRPQDMELVQMRYSSKCGLEEYAQSLNRSSGTLKARLFKIRAALRRCIEDSISDGSQGSISDGEVSA